MTGSAVSGTGIGIIGCGFVADYYLATLPGHPQLDLVAVTDRDQVRAATFGNHHEVTVAPSVDALLADERVQLVVNLTNPRNHVEVTDAALDAGKHVYSEKPLAMDIESARRLVDRAEQAGLRISCAPCSLLGETAQTIWKAVRDQRVGPVHLVYAEMDEGLVHHMPYRHWSSAAGAQWPAKDEFEVGTVIEHAGYVTSWLPAFFGPVERITGFAACRIPDKDGVATTSTDFSVGVLEFESGVVARVTCSLIAPHDHSLRIVGDSGVISTADTWDYGSTVYLRRSVNIRQRHQWLPRRRLPLVGRTGRYRYRGGHQMDFARGVADLADAVRHERRGRLPADFCLHVNEVTLALHHALRESSSYEMTTTFAPLKPAVGHDDAGGSQGSAVSIG